jgi:hypothetical protein
MKGRHLPHLNQADAPSVYPIAFFNKLQIFSREKGFGEYQKNDRWNAKKVGKYTGKARSTAKILPMLALAPRHPFLNSSYPRRLLPRTEGGSTKSQRNR